MKLFSVRRVPVDPRPPEAWRVLARGEGADRRGSPPLARVVGALGRLSEIVSLRDIRSLSSQLGRAGLREVISYLLGSGGPVPSPSIHPRNIPLSVCAPATTHHLLPQPEQAPGDNCQDDFGVRVDLHSASVCQSHCPRGVREHCRLYPATSRLYRTRPSCIPTCVNPLRTATRREPGLSGSATISSRRNPNSSNAMWHATATAREAIPRERWAG